MEYVASFVLGLFIFQALLAKEMMGCSYGQAVKLSLLPQWLSMNAVMAGMIPVMVILMSHDKHTMEPAWLRFWGILLLASLVGTVLAYPVNWWLVNNGLQPGMSGMKREDRNTIPTVSKLAVTLVTVAMLAGGVAFAARYGNLQMDAANMNEMPMPAYLHDGRLPTLDDTVEFFNLILELKLGEQDKKDLVAFMRQL